MRTLAMVVLLSLPATEAWTSTSFAVTNSGISAYLIDGDPNPTLGLLRGETYIFNVNATGHPFYVKTARVTGSGSQYTSGVTGQAAQSSALTFVVPMDAPSTLYYQCGVHGSMGGTLNISNPVGVTPGKEAAQVAWLAPVAPNPGRGEAVLAFDLPRAAAITFDIFDVRGRRVRELASGALPGGRHTYRWDGRDAAGDPVPSGLYFSRLRVEGWVLSGRFVMTR